MRVRLLPVTYQENTHASGSIRSRVSTIERTLNSAEESTNRSIPPRLRGITRDRPPASHRSQNPLLRVPETHRLLIRKWPASSDAAMSSNRGSASGFGLLLLVSYAEVRERIGAWVKYALGTSSLNTFHWLNSKK